MFLLCLYKFYHKYSATNYKSWWDDKTHTKKMTHGKQSSIFSSSHFFICIYIEERKNTFKVLDNFTAHFPETDTTETEKEKGTNSKQSLQSEKLCCSTICKQMEKRVI